MQAHSEGKVHVRSFAPQRADPCRVASAGNSSSDMPRQTSPSASDGILAVWSWDVVEEGCGPWEASSTSLSKLHNEI